ncbi:probable WRKY transcription factor 32 [Impatiens glandulifera]|uniref:probable WRKY transcription factor 32 n=1 Tax=Impatiens glandulifera TaxID=253017 RepID=UPI001FB09990|nr:probable WRKY transcription factor 32 [Impatiens glandulifera]
MEAKELSLEPLEAGKTVTVTAPEEEEEEKYDREGDDDDQSLEVDDDVRHVKDGGEETRNNSELVILSPSIDSELSKDVPVDSAVLGIPEKVQLKEALEILPIKSSQALARCPKTLCAAPSVKIPSSDGYNWRKYGQKQVKSPQGSRSYYRCSQSNCHAKKIECNDQTNCVIDIINKGAHNHEQPKKTVNKESRLALCVTQSSADHLVSMLNDLDQSSSSKEPIQEAPNTPESTVQKLTGLVEVGEGGTEGHIGKPDSKRRMKKSDSGHVDSSLKSSKKNKFVVHAVGDMGTSGDGYRWRKYGQKMVKGNRHPRNYYRCTSAGCPVRKHTERAVDNPNALIITYKGNHDHGMPVPKKRHCPPVAAATSQPKKSKTLSESLEVAEEKAFESAQTLLSIGFELKQF